VRPTLAVGLKHPTDIGPHTRRRSRMFGGCQACTLSGTDLLATEVAPLACGQCSYRPGDLRFHFGMLLKPEAPR
jgi:hypothetical protein